MVRLNNGIPRTLRRRAQAIANIRTRGGSRGVSLTVTAWSLQLPEREHECGADGDACGDHDHAGHDDNFSAIQHNEANHSEGGAVPLSGPRSRVLISAAVLFGVLRRPPRHAMGNRGAARTALRWSPDHSRIRGRRSHVYGPPACRGTENLLMPLAFITKSSDEIPCFILSRVK